MLFFLILNLNIGKVQPAMFDDLTKNFLGSDHHYCFVIDAEKEGTRIVAYNFATPSMSYGPTHLTLVDSFENRATPGLSASANDPNQGAISVVKLIKSVQFMVPPHKRPFTPILVRTTGGLRVMAPVVVESVLTAVYNAIVKLGYSPLSSVGVLDESDEGTFFWYTVNFLYNTLSSEKSMLGALYMETRWTQIAFTPPQNNIHIYPPKDITKVPVLNRFVTLYSESYQNLGIKAAQLGVMRLEAGDQTENDFTSICVHPTVKNIPWNYFKRQFYVTGASRKNVSITEVVDRCYQLVRRYVLDTMTWKPEEPARAVFVATSDFYRTASASGMIDSSGGLVPIGKYRSQAKEECSEAPHRPESEDPRRPWLCFRLLFLYALLHDGYKFPDEDSIVLVRRINGHEATWTLGLAYTTIMMELQKANNKKKTLS